MSVRSVAFEVARLLFALAVLLVGLEGFERLFGPRDGGLAHADPRAPRAADADEVREGLGPTSYELDVSLDAANHRISGRGSIRWRNTSVLPQRELWLHAYLNAFRDDGSVFARGPGGAGFRGGSGKPDHHGSLVLRSLRVREFGVDLLAALAPGEDDTDWRVPLPREVPPGETLTLEVAFEAELPSIVLRTGYAGSFHMAAQWFPKLARLEPDGRWAHFPLHRLSEFYADFGDYDVTIEVPAGFLVGATGVPRGAEVREGARKRQRYQATRVHDFAFAAWDGFEEIRVAAGAVELVSLFPRDEQAEAERELEIAARGLAHFGERYGGYPYRRLTIVRPPAEASEAGGMEYPTLITTGAGNSGRWVGVRAIEALTLHELAHQWFQGMVASDEARYPMLDEGLATYAELEAMEAFWPGRSGFDAFGLRVASLEGFRFLASRDEVMGALDRPASAFLDGRDYVAAAYARTAMALLTLGRTFGEEGMRRALARYAREQRFRHPTPADLERCVRTELGDTAADALHAIVAGGRVDVAVERFDSWPREPGPESIRGGFEGRVVVVRRGEVILPVTLSVRTLSGKESRATWDARAERAEVAWSGDEPIESVQLDPQHAVLLDARGAERLLGPGRLPLRTFAAASFLGQLVASLVLP